MLKTPDEAEVPYPLQDYLNDFWTGVLEARPLQEGQVKGWRMLSNPELTLLRTNALLAVFLRGQPVFVLTDIPPPDGVSGLETIAPLLDGHFGTRWFAATVVPAAREFTDRLGEVADAPNPTRTRLLTLIAAWWTLAHMANTGVTFDGFLRLAAHDNQRAADLWGELTARLHRLTVEALGGWPEAVLLPEIRDFIDALVSALEKEDGR